MLRDIHSANVLHRDIKGGNVCITSGGLGGVVIIDFGLAVPLQSTDEMVKKRKRSFSGTAEFAALAVHRLQGTWKNQLERYSEEFRPRVWAI